MDPSDVKFTKSQRCGICDLPIQDGVDNWGCAHAWVPVEGPVLMTVELHQHVHIGCADGVVKMLALSALGRSRLGAN